MPGLVLLLGAAMAGLVLSCGGGSNNNCGTIVNGQFVPGPCSQVVPPLGAQLKSIDVCTGPPAGPTAKPTGTESPSPTATFTPCPNPTATTAMFPNPVELNAAGLFNLNGKKFYRDLTGTAAWFVNAGGNLSYNSNGQFSIINNSSACGCVTASSGGITGGPVLVAIAPNGGPVPACSPCPTIAPTPAASLRSAASTAPAKTAVVMWRVDAGAAFDGRLAVAPSGAIYFITADGLLHAIDAAGGEVFTRFTDGGSPLVASNGIIFASAPGGGLMALDAAGKVKWITRTAAGVGPLATASDGRVYDVAGSDLVCLDGSTGTIIWRIAIPGVQQVIVTPDDEIIAVTDAGMVALSAAGTTQWTFAPSGGVVGNAAITGDAIFAASSAGTLYALRPSTGNELWERELGGPPAGGVAASANGGLYVGGAQRLGAFDPAGGHPWSLNGIKPDAVAPAVAPDGTVFVAAAGGHLAAVTPAGKLRWVAGNFGVVRSMAVTSPNILYVMSEDGICWKLKEISENQ